MAHYVLIHGAWHGGWCWREVARMLRAQGHTVFTPTLTGNGESRHLGGERITLETHTRDVLGLIAPRNSTTSSWSATATAAW